MEFVDEEELENPFETQILSLIEKGEEVPKGLITDMEDYNISVLHMGKVIDIDDYRK